MLCEMCHEREACVKITAIVNGKRKTANLCAECANKFQENQNSLSAGNINDAIMNFLNSALFQSLKNSGMESEDEGLNDDSYSETFLKVLEEAKKAKQELKAPSVGSEHLLLGLLRTKEGIAYEVLRLNGVRDDEVSQLIEKYLTTNYQVLEFNKSAFSPMSLRLLREALAQSKADKQEKCGTEYLLLQILQNTNCSASRLLNSMSIDMSKLTEDLKMVIRTGNVSDVRQANATSKRRKTQSNTPNLDKCSRDLTLLAENGALDPCIGRETEINRLIQTLSRRTKNNPCLIGEPGVGKTAVVEGLALKIASGDVPDIMKNKRLVSLDLTSMVAGTKYRGEFEERIKNVINEVTEDRNIILFIDEIHTIIGAGGAEGSLDAANIIKPALSRGELQLVGATTITEYRKHIEKDAALERRFQPVTVEEPSEEESIDILFGLRDKYEEHHHVKISRDAVIACVHLSKRYLQERFLPDKAIDLMDEAMSKLRLASYKKPSKIQRMEARLEGYEQEREALIIALQFDMAKKVESKKKRLQTMLAKEKAAFEASNQSDIPVVEEEQIQDIISEWTKIPVKTLKKSDAERLRTLEETLHERVVTQDEAVTAVSKAVRRGRVGLKDPKRPIGSFLFLGPTGVGKTELSKALSEAVFGSEKAMIRVDMSEYMEKHSVSKLVGSPPGYVGFEEGGQLSEKVRRTPYSVILFDEIEKAHPDVFNILLQVLDDGVITDSQGRKIDFKNTIIIMTSNLGAEQIMQPKNLGFGAVTNAAQDYEKMKERVLDAVKKAFKPEFLNRIDGQIVFHPLDKSNMSDIVNIMLGQFSSRVKQDLRMNIRFTDKAKAYIIDKGYDPKYGARPLKRAIQNYVEDGLADAMLDGRYHEGDTITVSADDKGLTFKKK